MQFIALVPTTLFIFCVLTAFLTGLKRGFRKSTILFIFYLCTLLIAVLVFFAAQKILIVDEFKFSFGFLSMFMDVGFDLSESMSLVEFANNMAVEHLPADLVPFIQMPHVQAFVITVGSLIMNLVCVLIAWLGYLLSRFIFFIAYLIFFKKSRYKQKRIEIDGEYRNHSILGGLVGVFKGVVSGFIMFSSISTALFILTGDVAPGKHITNTGLDSSFEGMTDMYNGVLDARHTGLGAFFRDIKFNGKPIDYMIADFIMSAEYKGIHDESVTINLREEAGGMIKFFMLLVDHGLMDFLESSDDDVVALLDGVLAEIDQEDFSDIVSVLAESKLITEVGYSILIDFAQENFNDLEGYQFSDLFTNEMLKEINLANDLMLLSEVLFNLVNVNGSFSNLVDLFGEESSLVDFFKLDVERVKGLFNAISESTFVTELLVSAAKNYMSSDARGEFLEHFVFDIDSILWNDEIRNLGSLYEALSKMTISDDLFGDNFLNSITELFKDDAELANADNLVSLLFDSDLVFKLSISLMDAYQDTNGGSSSDDLIGILLSYITTTDITKGDLKEDVRSIIHILGKGSSLVKVLNSDASIGGLDDFLALLTPAELKEIFLGSAEYRGLLTLKLISNADEFIGELLSTTISNPDEVFGLTQGELKELNWRNEIEGIADSLIIAEANGISLTDFSNDFVKFDGISSADSDLLADSLNKSIIIRTLFTDAISSPGSSLANSIAIPANVNWDNDFKPMIEAVLGIASESKLAEFINASDSEYINVFATISDDTLRKIGSSVVLVNSLEKQLKAQSAEIEVIIPVDTDWKVELIAFKKVANIPAFQTAGKFDIGKLSNVNTFAELDEEADIDVICLSSIMTATIPNGMEKAAQETNELYIPLDVKWENEDTKKGEFYHLVVAFKAMKKVCDDNSWGEVANNLSKAIINLPDFTLVHNSKVISHTIVNTIIDYSTDPTGSLYNQVFIPNTPHDFHDVNNTLWYSSGISKPAKRANENAPDGELDALLVALRALGIKDLSSFDLMELEDIFTKADEVSDSYVLSFTVSEQMNRETQPGGDFYEKIFIPNGFEDVSNTLYANWKETEIKAIFSFLNALGYTKMADLVSNDIATNDRVFIRGNKPLILDSVVITYTIARNVYIEAESPQSTLIVPSWLPKENSGKLDSGWFYEDGEVSYLLEYFYDSGTKNYADLAITATEATFDPGKRNGIINSAVLCTTAASAIINASKNNSAVHVADFLKNDMEHPLWKEKEISSLFDVLWSLEVENFENFDIETNELIFTPETETDILNSLIASNSVVKKLIELNDVGTLNVPLNLRSIDAVAWYEPVDQSLCEISAVFSTARVLGIKKISDIDFEDDDLNEKLVDINTSSYIIDSAVMSFTFATRVIDSNDIFTPSQLINGDEAAWRQASNGQKAEIKAIYDVIYALEIKSLKNLSLDANSKFSSIEAEDAIIDSAVISFTVATRVCEKNGTDFIVPTHLLSDKEAAVWRYGEGDEKSELRAIINAMRVFNITDLGNVTIPSNDKLLKNPEAITQSQIFSATTIDKILTTQGINIPLRLLDAQNPDWRFVSVSGNAPEIWMLFNAIDTLGLTDFENVNTDALDITSEANIKATIPSAVMSYTYVNKIVTESQGTQIHLPTRYQSSEYDGWYGVGMELERLLNAFRVIGVTNVANADISQQTDIFSDDKRSAIVDSDVMTCSFAGNVRGNSEFITPLEMQDLDHLRWYGEGKEIDYLIEALNHLFPGSSIDNIGAIDLVKVYQSKNEVCRSLVLNATMTDKILNNATSKVSNSDLDVSLESELGTQFMIEDVMVAFLTAVEALGITDTNNLTVSLASLTAKNSEELDIILASTIIGTTITDSILANNANQFPKEEVEQYGNLPKINDGELKRIIIASKHLGIADFNNVSNVSFSAIGIDDIVIITESLYIRVLISASITSSGAIVLDELRIDKQAYDDTVVSLIEHNELNAFLTAMKKLGLTDYNPTGLNFDEVSIEYVFESLVLHASVSHEIENNNSFSGVLITEIMLATNSSNVTHIIKEDEIRNLALGYLALNIRNFTAGIDFGVITGLTQETKETIFASVLIRGFFSRAVIEDGVLVSVFETWYTGANGSNYIYEQHESYSVLGDTIEFIDETTIIEFFNR